MSAVLSSPYDRVSCIFLHLQHLISSFLERVSTRWQSLTIMSKRAAATFSLPLGALSGSVAKRPRLSSPAPATGIASITATIATSPRADAPSSLATEATQKPNSGFDIDAYAASLSTVPRPGSGVSERELLALEVATIDPSWLELLQHEIRKPYFIKLKEQLWKEGVRGVHGAQGAKTNVFPPAQDIYSWSRHTPVHRARVVGIGQDPYHGKGEQELRYRRGCYEKIFD